MRSGSFQKTRDHPRHDDRQHRPCTRRRGQAEFHLPASLASASTRLREREREHASGLQPRTPKSSRPGPESLGGDRLCVVTVQCLSTGKLTEFISQRSHLTSRCLFFLIYKMRIKLIKDHHSYYKNKNIPFLPGMDYQIHTHKAFGTFRVFREGLLL